MIGPLAEFFTASKSFKNVQRYFGYVRKYHLRHIQIVEENVKTVIVEEPLNGSKKVDGTTRNTDHTATVRWSDIVKNGGPGSIGDQMNSKEKGKSS